jgi:hypothetical protein
VKPSVAMASARLDTTTGTQLSGGTGSHLMSVPSSRAADARPRPRNDEAGPVRIGGWTDGGLIPRGGRQVWSKCRVEPQPIVIWFDRGEAWSMCGQPERRDAAAYLFVMGETMWRHGCDARCIMGCVGNDAGALPES